MNPELENVLNKSHAWASQICKAYSIEPRTFSKYVSESKVKVIKRGCKICYKTSDVHTMLSERGYPRAKRTKKASIGVEA